MIGMERDETMEAAILGLLAERQPAATICPSEAARRVAGDDDEQWRPRMDAARDAARRLARKGAVEITQRGAVVDPETARGPIRIRRAQPPSDG